MILRQFYFAADEKDLSLENETTIFISTCIKKFQYVESARIHFLDLLNSLRSSVARLRFSSTSILLEGILKSDKRVTLYLPNSLRKENSFLNCLLTTDMHICFDRKSSSLIYHFTKLFWLLEENDQFDTQYRMPVALDNIPAYLMFLNNEDLLIPLTFVPSHLRNLYDRLLKEKFITINPRESIANNRQHLYFGHILTECLIFLSNPWCKRLSIRAASLTLLPWLQMQQLENFGSSLLWTLDLKESDALDAFEKRRKLSINHETDQYTHIDKDSFLGSYLTDEERKRVIQDNIEQEYQRLKNASVENDQRNVKLYSASISLARICRWTDDGRKSFLLEQSINGAMSIQNKLARLDALCVIAFYLHSDYDQIRIDRDRSLKKEIEHQFNEIYLTLPLLLQTIIFIRCLPLLQHSKATDDCLQNIINKFANTDQRDQQAVIEALLPYMQMNSTFSSISNYFSYNLQEQNKTIHNKSSALKTYIDIGTHENLSFSLFMSNLYLVELANDFNKLIKMDNRQLNINEPIEMKLFEFNNNILTGVQALAITNILSFISSTNRYNQYEKLLVTLSNTLHRANLIELKACRLLESWLKWKDSNEYSCFAYHAALLLINSHIWSVETTTIVCDLLCSDNDRFRQRAEIIFQSRNENDVLLILVKKKVHYQLTSASTKLKLIRLFSNIIIDVQSHLETLLWLERYRIHALTNKKYSFNKLRSSTNSIVATFFSTDIAIDACTYINFFRLSF
ncbi:unnamed protein product [Rotaria sp. Silwood2]|nr:unnamed protein product [Rotaria sp. Silwood2]